MSHLFNQHVIDLLFKKMSDNPYRIELITRAIWSIANKCPSLSIQVVLENYYTLY